MYMCDRGIERGSVFTIFALDFGTVPSVWHCLFFVLLAIYTKYKKRNMLSAKTRRKNQHIKHIILISRTRNPRMQTLTQSYNESRTGAWVTELLRSSIYGHKINTTTVGSGLDNQPQL